MRSIVPAVLGLAAFAAVIVASVASAQETVSYVPPKGFDATPLSVPPASIAPLLQKVWSAELADDPQGHILAAPVDLDGKKPDKWLTMFSSPSWCGAASCPMKVVGFAVHGGKPVPSVIFDHNGPATPETFAVAHRPGPKGIRSLALDQAVYVWDGTTYVLDKASVP